MCEQILAHAHKPPLKMKEMNQYVQCLRAEVEVLAEAPAISISSHWESETEANLLRNLVPPLRLLPGRQYLVTRHALGMHMMHPASDTEEVTRSMEMRSAKQYRKLEALLLVTRANSIGRWIAASI